MSPREAKLADHPDFLLVTCEHGGNEVPPAYRHLFTDAGSVLDSHRGYDIGALQVALRIASHLTAPIVFSTTTRLLIDLNRSLGSASLFSEFSQLLDEETKGRLVQTMHKQYRASITRIITSAITTGHRVIHIGVHSFTDVWEGRPREIDLALLFDESRPAEAKLCEQWQASMHSRFSAYRYHFNKPYRGTDDGLTTAMRHMYAPDNYLGIEIEVRQGLLNSRQAQDNIGKLLANSLFESLKPPR